MIAAQLADRIRGGGAVLVRHHLTPAEAMLVAALGRWPARVRIHAGFAQLRATTFPIGSTVAFRSPTTSWGRSPIMSVKGLRIVRSQVSI